MMNQIKKLFLHDKFKYWLAVLVPYALFMLAISVRLPLAPVLLPYANNWDEPFLVNPAIQTLRTGDFNPYFQRYPSGGVWLQLMSAAATTLSLVKQGVIDSQHQLRTFYDTRYLWTISNPEIYYNGRVVTSLLGSALVIVIFLIGRRWYGMTTACIAAVIAAVSPAMVEHSAYITTDMPATAFAASSLIPMLILANKKDRATGSTVAVAGILCAAASAMKYNAAFVVVPYFVAHFLRFGLKGFWNRFLLIFLLTFGVACVVLSPYAIFDFRMFMDEMVATAVLYGRKTNMPEGTGTWGHLIIYLNEFKTSVLSLPLLILGFLGLIAGFWLNPRSHAVLVTYWVVSMYLFSSVKMHYLRTALPAVPALLLFVPLPVQLVATKWGGKVSVKPLWLKLAICIMAVLALHLAVKTVQYIGQQRSAVDPRQQLVDALDNRPAGSRIAFDSNLHLHLPADLRQDVVPVQVSETASKLADRGFDFIVVPGQYRFRDNNPELRDVEALLNQKFAGLPVVKEFGSEPLTFGWRPKNTKVELRALLNVDKMPQQTGDILPGLHMTGIGLRLPEFMDGAIGLWSRGHLQGEVNTETSTTKLLVNMTGIPDRHGRFPVINIKARAKGGSEKNVVENYHISGRGAFQTKEFPLELSPGKWEIIVQSVNGAEAPKLVEPDLPNRVLVRWVKLQ